LQAKPCAEFYLGKGGKPRGKCKECCRSTWDKSGVKRTPAQRAEYIRRRGETTAEYLGKAERLRIAAERRASQIDAHVKAWRAAQRAIPRHDAHVARYRARLDSLAHTARWRARYQTDPEFALEQRLRTQLRKKAKLFPKLDDLMRDALNRQGGSNIVERACGYTISQLRTHLEALFSVGMSWQAFACGDIHIDHIRPQSSFDLNDADQVRACWALSNLQPLWSTDNLTKGACTDWARPDRAAQLSGGSLERFF
jgi:hypothetical protein